MLAIAALWIGTGAIGSTAIGGGPPDLVTATAHDHAKYRDGLLSPHLETSAAAAVRDYLEPRLGVELGALPDGGGWRIRGLRLCYLKNSYLEKIAVGLVMLERSGVPVSLFVLSPDAAAALGSSPSARVRGYELDDGHVALVARDGVVRCAVGDVPVEHLKRLVEATQR